MVFTLKKIVSGFFFLVFVFHLSQAKVIHVAVDGKKEASGSIHSPMSLAQAFSSVNRSGDTIMLHGGDYYGNFTCWASGEKGRPLVIMPYNNEVVRIIGEGGNDMTLSLNGGYCVVRDLIITQTPRKRVSSGNHSWPEDVVSESGVTIVGRGVRFINNIIHDVYGNGLLSSGSNGFDAEISGNIIFNTGWIGSENGHGHGMYLQSNDGSKQANNNVVFNTYGHGFQFYTTGGQRLEGMSISNNIVFNAGVPASRNNTGGMRNFMLGGNASIKNLTVRENYTFLPENSPGTGMQVGYNTVNESCIVEDNYVARGNKVFVMYRFNSGSFRNNTIIGNDEELLTSLYFPEGVDHSDYYKWDENSYYAHQEKFFDANNNRMLSFEEWQNQLGFDRKGSFKHLSSLKNYMKVIPNRDETGRAHLVVYNWERKDSVLFDLNLVLNKGDAFQVFDVENIFEPVAAGNYNGKGITLPMNLEKVIQPSGEGSYSVSHTGAEFGAFLVISGKRRTKTREAHYENLSIVKAYPNPTKDFVIVEYLLPKAGMVKARVFDLNGKLMLSREEKVNFGQNKFLINLSELQLNTYVLSLDDGVSSDSCKVILER
ncbi:T9SS type A sorting domain-containing protein [Marinilabilia salmonicolor]|uniref:Probable pectate lyase C n=1 Tax=Marinilabilia salmonicolor TaxID=989 RepID=A0A368V6I0_9BACT|nr:T9SS type A sorting domain-containing protein [Marinilabilia salmonicolor]RCW36726.1 putative secreted protein (Por secretion system target) [Marinilabilia salmonicolor]